MDIVADTSNAKNAHTHEPLSRAHSGRVVLRAGIENLNVEIVNKNPLLPTDRKWAIRFGAGEIVTVVLGMRDYGRGWFSAYFAGLWWIVSGSRSGVYASTTAPLFQRSRRRLEYPGFYCVEASRDRSGAAAGNITSEMCGLVIEKGRLASAAVAGVGAADVDFDASTGCFFVRNTGWSGRTLNIAKIARDGTSASTEFVKNLRGKNKVANEAYEPSDA